MLSGDTFPACRAVSRTHSNSFNFLSPTARILLWAASSSRVFSGATLSRFLKRTGRMAAGQTVFYLVTGIPKANVVLLIGFDESMELKDFNVTSFEFEDVT